MAHRVQGVLLTSEPSTASLETIGRSLGYRLFYGRKHRIWLLDFGVAQGAPGDEQAIATARTLAPTYVDALRILCGPGAAMPQIHWLNAAGLVARTFKHRTIGFLSDDATHDFAVVVGADGVESIADRVEPYLLRWTPDELWIQPYTTGDMGASSAEPPEPPDAMYGIAGLTVLPAEALPDEGYPLHGNVIADMDEFAPGLPDALGLGSWEPPAPGTIVLARAGTLDASVWDEVAALR